MFKKIKLQNVVYSYLAYQFGGNFAYDTKKGWFR
jgi:hypothetical protein